MNEKELLIKGGYSVEVSVSDGKEIIWEVVDDHVAEEGNNHDEIGLRGFYIDFFGKNKKGVIIEGFIEYPYLLILMKLWYDDLKNQS